MNVLTYAAVGSFAVSAVQRLSFLTCAAPVITMFLVFKQQRHETLARNYICCCDPFSVITCQSDQSIRNGQEV
jgi:hypothetical protein